MDSGFFAECEVVPTEKQKMKKKKVLKGMCGSIRTVWPASGVASEAINASIK